MAVLLVDGYDHYTSPVEKYLSSEWAGAAGNFSFTAVGGGVFSYGRSVTPGYNCFYKPFVAQAQTMIWNSHVYFVSAASSRVLYFGQGGASQCELETDWNGGLSMFRWNLKRNGTSVATSAYYLLQATWYWVSVKLTVDPSSGLFEVIAGGTTTTFNGNTRTTGTSLVDQVAWGSHSIAYTAFDNTIVNDTAGSVANDHLPEARVYYSLPSANDAVQFTPSAGANYQCVDENPQNGDTDYNSDATVGDQDTFVAATTAGSATILGMQVASYARKDDAGARAIRHVVKSVAAVADSGANMLLNVAYLPFRTIQNVDPNTSAQWAGAAADAAKIGYKVAA